MHDVVCSERGVLPSRKQCVHRRLLGLGKSTAFDYRWAEILLALHRRDDLMNFLLAAFLVSLS